MNREEKRKFFVFTPLRYNFLWRSESGTGPISEKLAYPTLDIFNAMRYKDNPNRQPDNQTIQVLHEIFNRNPIIPQLSSGLRNF